MNENHAKTSAREHVPGAQINSDPSAHKTTDPKFVRESFTMRRMQPWQIAALAIAAAVVFGLAFFYL
jgi:hypothetical protein